MSNGQYYIGSTGGLENRLLDHERGSVVSTRKYRPHILLYKRIYGTKKDAMFMERWVKKQKSRGVIERFMAGEFS